MNQNSNCQANVQNLNFEKNLTVKDYLKLIGMIELGANIFATPKKKS